MDHCGILLILQISLILLARNIAGLETESMIGGLPAIGSQYPYQISLQLSKSHKCGGALIEADIVLSAAHCVYDDTNPLTITDWPYVAVAGTTDVNNQKYSILVSKIYAHRNFKRGKGVTTLNDIAVLKLADKFDVSGRLPIKVVSLPLKNENYLGRTAIVSGFGWDQVSVTVDPVTLEKKEVGSSKGKLKYGLVSIVEPSNCEANDNSHLLCGQLKQRSSYQHEGVCTGDSGGPLVYNNRIIGVVSKSPIGCDESVQPGSYTKVSDFLDFVKNAKDDTPSSDMVVKELNFEKFTIPSLSIKGTTNSPRLKTALRLLEKYGPKYEAAVKELKSLEESVKQSMASVKAIEVSLQLLGKVVPKDPSKLRAYKSKYEEYQKKFQDYRTKFNVFEAKEKETKTVEKALSDAEERFRALRKTEKLYI